MIDHIRGKLASKSPTYIRVEVNGVGYGIHIPLSTYDGLTSVEDEVQLHTYLYVREDCLQLYGFKTSDEKELFQMLISVSGVGPRVALGILSGLSVKEFREAVASENLRRLTAIAGIGKKTAQRLVVDLKEKVGLALVTEEVEKMARAPEEMQLVNDAISALVSLGCKPSEATKAVKEAQVASRGKIDDLEDLVKQALKHL